MLRLPKLIAHRGASLLAPENTLVAFEMAHRAKAKMVEFDVTLSKDNVPIIFHDDKLNRTSNGKGLVWEHTWEELEKLDAGNWFKKDFANTQIPTLEATLDLFKKSKLAANIEIKDSGDVPRNINTLEMAEPIIIEFTKTNTCIVSSFCPETLEMARKLLPKIALGMLLDIEDWDKDFVEQRTDIKKRYKSLQCNSLHINDAELTAEKIARLKKFAKQIAVFTVNDAKRAQQLFDWGVSAVFSDDVNLLKTVQ